MSDNSTTNMTHLFYIMRPQEPRYLQGFIGDGPTWNTGACWADHRAFAMAVPTSLFDDVLDGVAHVPVISLHPTTMDEQTVALGEWIKADKLKTL